MIPEVTFQLGYLNACIADMENDPATHRGHINKAVASFQEFANRWPDNPLAAEALYELGCNQYGIGRFDDAIGSFEKVIASFPNSTFAPLAAYEIANCYGAEGKGTEEAAQFRNFVARYPTHPRVGSALCRIASQLDDEGKTDEALTIYHDVIARAVSSPEGSSDFRDAALVSEQRISAILGARGDAVGAVAGCEKLLAKFHDDPETVSSLIAQIADAYRGAKQFADAYARLDHLAAEYPQNDSVRVATVTSTIDLALDQHDIARAYDATLKLLADPKKDHLPSASYVAIGNALIKRDRFAEAREAYGKSLRMYPNDSATAPLAQLGLGEAALGLRQLVEAEQVFLQAMVKYRKVRCASARSWVLRGSILRVPTAAIRRILTTQRRSSFCARSWLARPAKVPEKRPTCSGTVIFHLLGTTVRTRRPHWPTICVRRSR